MRTGTLRYLAGVAVATLLLGSTARAQNYLSAANKLAPAEAAPVAEAPGRSAAPAYEEEARAEGNRSAGWFASLEYLLWRPRRQAHDFVIHDPNAGNNAPEGKVETLDWELGSGFRALVGYRTERNWELAVAYTYLYANDNRAVTPSAAGLLYPTLTHPTEVTKVNYASAESDIHYNVIDIEFAKQFEATESLGLRLFGGPRIAFINQKVTSVYDGLEATGDRVFSRINFDGGGVRAGGEGRWHIREGFSIWGRAGMALVLGHFETQLIETNNFGLQSPIVNISDRFDKVVPVSELALGVAWERGNWRAAVAYELVNWFGLVDSPDFVDDIAVGKPQRRLADVSLSGVTFQVSVGY